MWVGIRIHRLNKLRKIEGVIKVFAAHGAGKRSTQGTHRGPPPHQGFDYAVKAGSKALFQMGLSCSESFIFCYNCRTVIEWNLVF